jgi:uncharacterized protein (TIGR02588 family)
MSGRDARTAAEWTSFAVSLVVLAVVVGLIGVQMLGSHDPAAPVAEQSDAVRVEGGQFFVPVEVTNHGDATAENVQVSAELTIDGETTDGDQTVDFLSGGEAMQVEFAFDDDPGDGELVVRVTGYSVP